VLLALATRLRRLGLGLAALGALGLVVGGFSPLANWVIVPLEERFPAFSRSDGPVDGVVVLGGSFQAGESLARGQATINEAGERIVALADLARRYPAAKLVFSGGAGELLSAEAPEADALKRYLGTFGVSPDRVVFENRSRTTSENAAFSRALIEPAPSERWLLVTSAWHMPRAVGCFRKAGLRSPPTRSITARAAGGMRGAALPAQPMVCGGSKSGSRSGSGCSGTASRATPTSCFRTLPRTRCPAA
jgi:uncharacterized SAM-binding protein YcdF (DUF218 family)